MVSRNYYNLAFLVSLQFAGSAVIAPPVWAENDSIHINPLMTLPETLHQVKMDCAGRPYDYRCIQTIERIQKDIEKLKEICKKQPGDMRCDAIRHKDRDRQSEITIFCSDNPDNDTCVRRRQMFKKSALQKAMICKRRPDSPNCRPPVAKPDTAASRDEYCQIYPDRKDCQRFLRDKETKRKQNLRQREREAGNFTF
jgi:hypothetical protein